MNGKGWQGNWFEDFRPGDRLLCPTPRTVTQGDVSSYIALTGDRTPRYCGEWGMVHPLVVFHAVFGQTVRQISLNARANLGYSDVRWLAPVRVGDTLFTELEILGARENSSRTTGIVYVRTTGTNQRGQDVLSYIRWVMVKKRSEAPTPYLEAPIVPLLPESVEADRLHPSAPIAGEARATQGRWYFQDYEIGERVHHFDGQTVVEADHMSFTRLFQNSARIHFDAILTEGKPLVYGGFPMSLAYAQAFNGFENRLGICGINAGAHANPIHSGDTVYSFTEIMDKRTLASHPGVGVLRCRLVAVKNVDPSRGGEERSFEVQVDDPKKAGSKRYNPSVALDLDFWEAIPIRGA